eukprot:scaffold2831_cov249-Ochromonas_danica.AAC.43
MILSLSLLLTLSSLLFLSSVRANNNNNNNNYHNNGNSHPNGNGQNGQNGHKGHSHHPALSEACVDFLDELHAHPPSPTAGLGGQGKRVLRSAVVIVTVHNPNPSLLQQSIQSILSSSSSSSSSQSEEMVTLKSIIIADQGSYPAVRSWDLWTSSSSSSSYSHMVHHVYQPIGGSRADLQNTALASLSLKKAEEEEVMVVFMPLGLVTPNFLSPLAFALWRTPGALVYPSEDLLLLVDGSSGGSGSEEEKEEEVRVVPGDEELVAGFDWQFRLRWEDPNSGRVLRGGGGGSSSGNSVGKYELLSPSLPHTFATAYTTLQLLGPFDSLSSSSSSSTTTSSTSTTTSSTSSMEGDSDLTVYSLVEYAMRAWLCGHSVVKARCAHVAIEQHNLLGSALPVGDHVSQRGVDRVVVQLGRKWLDRLAQESVYQARFIGRPAVLLQQRQEEVAEVAGLGLAVDPMEIGPVQSSPLFTEQPPPPPPPPAATSSTPRLLCTSFSWYSREVYPGLLEDQSPVMNAFTQYSSLLVNETDLLLQPLVDFHFSSSRGGGGSGGGGGGGGGGSDQEMSSSIFSNEEKVNNEEEEERLRKRRDLIRQHGLKTLQLTQAGGGGGGGSMKAVFFEPPPIDPKANLQDALDDHSPKWAAAGQCDKEDVQVGKIRDVCRKSCQVCQPDYLLITPPPPPPQQQEEKDMKAAAAAAAAVIPPPPPPIVNNGGMIGGGGGGDGLLPIDETVAHQAFLSGQLPDSIITSRTRHPGSPCAIKGSSDSRLLDVIQPPPPPPPTPPPPTPPPIRLFCGIYTISTAHEENVRASRDTWGKRCDGFIAFSNLTDPSIPSLAIEHEGVESYQNMWQKSRSIWKTIYQHYHSRYDFFLLGGDDMLILVENLRHYLSSPEIQSLQHSSDGSDGSSSGLFLGRVFSPPNQLVFNSGGAGYVIDQKALTVLGENLDRPRCFPHQKGFWEDVNVANCLLVGGKITPYDTRDRQGRERFHPFPPGHHLDYRPPPHGDDWYVKYSGDRLKVGFECCSQESVSFHYLKATWPMATPWPGTTPNSLDGAKALYTLFDYYYNCPSRGQ